MQLNLPKKSTFWAAVVIAAVGVILELVHLVVIPGNALYLGGVAIALVVVAFVLLCLGLTMKGL